MSKDKIYLLVIAAILVAFFLREGCSQRDADKLIDDIANYKTESETYKTKLGLEVNTNRALTLETQNQIKSILATNDTLKEWLSKFKEIKGGVVIKETTIIKEVPVPFDKIIPCDFAPFPVKKETNDFQFYTTVSNTGLTIDSLKIPNESRIVIGEKKHGFLNMKTQMSVDVVNSNPYIQTSNISGFVYEPEKKWYERTWFHVAVGATVGVISTQYINNNTR